MSKSWNYQVAGTITVTTTGNIDDLDFQYCSVILMNNATLSTIRGLKAGFPGQEVTIVSIGAGQVNLPHQNISSAAANRLINSVTSGITPLAAGKGIATYKYDEITVRWRLINHNQGAMIAIPYASGNFTGSGTITWTVDAGDQSSLSFEIINNCILIAAVILTTSISGVGTDLRITLPNGYTCAFQIVGIARVNDNGAGFVAGIVYATTAGNTTLNFETIAGTNWAAAVNTTGLQASLLFPID